MSKRKTYAIFLSLADRIDVDLEFEKKPGQPPRLSRFAITYSAQISGRWKEVVRYDNVHGYLHLQRFSRSREPEPASSFERLRSDALLEACRQDLRRNWRRYRTLIESAAREE